MHALLLPLRCSFKLFLISSTTKLSIDGWCASALRCCLPALGTSGIIGIYPSVAVAVTALNHNWCLAVSARSPSNIYLPDADRPQVFMEQEAFYSRQGMACLVQLSRADALLPRLRWPCMTGAIYHHNFYTATRGWGRPLVARTVANARWGSV